MSNISAMGAEPLTPPREPPQEDSADLADTDMTCLLTSDLEYRPTLPLPDKMSNFTSPYYSGEAGPSRSRRDSGRGVGGGDYQSPPHGIFAMSPTGMVGGVGPNTSYGPTPFGVAPPSFNGGRPLSQNPNHVLLSAVNPGPSYATIDQLDVAFGYGLPRDDGTFTRLIPADTLPAHLTAQLNLPARQNSEGLIIVAPPRQPSPNSRNDPIPLISREVTARLPVFNPNGPQYAIAGPVNSQGPNSMPVNETPTRKKVYCSKWLHDGTCAFTQLGCRYLHEMPMDRETQRSLGLNGLPAWYRREHAVNLRALPAPPQQPTNRMQGNWRREESHGGPSSAPSGFGNMGSPPPYNPRQHALGPIGPPSLPPPQVPRDLKSEEGEVDEYGEELLYKGYGKGKGRQDDGRA